jgi:hypothetical protein
MSLPLKCAYCGTDITGTDHVEYDGMKFCNTIHRYSYKTEKTSVSPGNKSAGPETDGQKKKSQVWNIIGGGMGLALGAYAGVHVFVPFILMFGVLWVLNKTNTIPSEGRNIIALLTAQFGWMFIGAFFTGQWNIVSIDLLFVGVGIVWLLVRIHAIPIILLMLFECGVLFINGSLILQQEIGTEEHRALLVHIVLRIMVIIALGYGLFAVRKRSIA